MPPSHFEDHTNFATAQFEASIALWLEKRDRRTILFHGTALEIKIEASPSIVTIKVNEAEPEVCPIPEIAARARAALGLALPLTTSASTKPRPGKPGQLALF